MDKWYAHIRVIPSLMEEKLGIQGAHVNSSTIDEMTLILFYF
jgi:hypothetical protein